MRMERFEASSFQIRLGVLEKSRNLPVAIFLSLIRLRCAMMPPLSEVGTISHHEPTSAVDKTGITVAPNSLSVIILSLSLSSI